MQPYYKMIGSYENPIHLAIYRDRPENEWAIIVHGTMTDPRCFDSLANNFLRENINVAVLHLVGHGLNRREKVFTFDEMKRNTEEAIDWVFEKYKKMPFLIGTSQGGFVVSAVAAENKKIKAVFAHGIMIPELQESIYLTRLPKFLGIKIKAVSRTLKYLASIFPRMPIPYRLYIDPKKIGSGHMVRMMDEMNYYPLKHVASLFNADMSALTSGKIKCPVGVILLKKEKLFPAWYIRMVYEEIKAEKELIVIDSDTHSAFYEEPEKIAKAVTPFLRKWQ